MVEGIKNGTMTEQEYARKYTAMMKDYYKRRPYIWKVLLKRVRVTLVCFCPAGQFCHRLLLAEILAKLGAEYGGEIEQYGLMGINTRR